MSLPDPAFINQLAFADGTLFAVRWILPNLPSTHSLAASKGDMPFVWVGQSDYLPSLPKAARLNHLALLGAGTSLLVAYQLESCSTSCVGITVTRDAGVTWTQFTPAYQGDPVSLLSARSDGGDVLGAIYMPNGVYRLVRSTDEGRTWEGFPLYPNNPGLGGTASFELANGAIYSFLFGNVDRVYRLAPQGTSWEEVGPLPVGTPITAIMTKSEISARLWGQAYPIGSGRLQPGIAYFDVR